MDKAIEVYTSGFGGNMTASLTGTNIRTLYTRLRRKGVKSHKNSRTLSSEIIDTIKLKVVLGYTQKELALQYGVSTSTISNYAKEK